MKRIKTVGLASLVLATVSTLGLAQIKRLTLPQMVEESDSSIYGEITDSRAFKAGETEDGAFYFTALTIEGRSLEDGSQRSVEVLFYGGFVTEEDGVHNSEAPAADDVRIGNRVVAFYDWTDDAGAGVSGNFLYQAHGGVYRAVEGPRGTTVLGRGDGYAIASNVELQALDTELRSIYRRKAEGR